MTRQLVYYYSKLGTRHGLDNSASVGKLHLFAKYAYGHVDVRSLCNSALRSDVGPVSSPSVNVCKTCERMRDGAGSTRLQRRCGL